MAQKLFPFLVAALALVGCADPMIGKWQAKDYPDLDLEIRDGNDFADYLADGHIYVCSSYSSSCSFCDVNFQFRYAGTDRYEVQGTGGEDCSGMKRIEGGYCTLTEVPELDCTLPGGASLIYEKIDD